MSKKDKILDWLKMGESITQIKAIDYYNCYRLASVIHRLKQEGHNIRCENKRNMNTGSVHGEYTLVPEGKLF